MIVGTANPEVLGRGRPRMPRLDTAGLSLPGTLVFQAMFEMPVSAREAILPPGLHPTNPAALVVLAWACPESPFGPFALAQVRAQARSGTRPRGLVLGAVCQGEAAAAGLAEAFGFPTVPGEVALRRRYDGAHLRVVRDGEPALEIEAVDPEPLAPGDVQYSVTLNLAHTPRGLRLVQVEPAYAVQRAERLRPRMERFRAAAWNEPRLEPADPVSASIATADVELPPLRFLCRPDVMAFTGTEKV